MSLADADVAYASARSRLDQTFGVSVDSLTPLIENLVTGSQIGEWDLEAHVAFSIDLLAAETMAYNIGRFAQLDTRENVGRIVSRRLNYMRKEFWMKDSESTTLQGKSSTWENLTTRIQRWIRAISAERSAIPQPPKNVKVAVTETSTKGKPAATQQVAVLATQAAPVGQPTAKTFSAAVSQGRKRTQSVDKCAVCGSVHSTANCATLAQMQVAQRMMKVKELRLCVHCLKSGHEFRDCKEAPICNVTGCGKRHHPLFHGRPTFAALKEMKDISVHATAVLPVATGADPSTAAASQSIATLTSPDGADLLLAEIPAPTNLQVPLEPETPVY